MNLTLDIQTQERIQREIDRGHYEDPAEVISHALSLLEAQEEWFLRNKDGIVDHLEESMAQIERGEGISGKDARRILAERRAARVA